MRLLFLTEYYPGPGGTLTGGVEARAWEITRALAERHDVTVITSRRPGEPRTSTQGGVRILRVGLTYPYSNEGHVLKRLWWATGALVRALRLRADIVEGTSFLTYVPAALAGWVKRVPRIATYHETWVGGQWIRGKGWVTGGLGELWERLALRLTWTRIISVSEFTRRALVDAGIRAELIDVIPNGINLADFESNVGRKRTPTIVCVSRLIASKRLDVLIHAIPEVMERVPDVRVAIVGVGEEEDALRRLADTLGVADRIAFLGRVGENQAVRDIIGEARVFALPSEAEGFGIVLLEAMASGVPVVCSDIPPLREVTAGRGALLFPPGDSRELAAQATSLLTDDRAYEERAGEAVERAREFAWPLLIERLEAIYEEVAE